MTIPSQPDQATRPRLIINPIVWVNGRKWWLPLEDLELGDMVTVSRGGLVAGTGRARELLDALAVENARAGWTVHLPSKD